MGFAKDGAALDPRTGRPLSSTRSASIPLCVLHDWRWRLVIVVGATWLIAQPVGATAAFRRRHRQRTNRRRHRRAVVPRRRRYCSAIASPRSARWATRRPRVKIDATNLVVAPGFIDLLGQSEFNVLVDGRAASKILQGVTTEVTGEGSSIAPVNDRLIAGRLARTPSTSASRRTGARWPTTSSGSRSDRTPRSTSRRLSAPAASATT